MRANPFLMFQGEAGQALDLWSKIFPELEVLELTNTPRDRRKAR